MTPSETLQSIVEPRGLKAVASMAGVHYQALQSWIAGTRPVPPARAALLAQAIGRNGKQYVQIAESLCPDHTFGFLRGCLLWSKRVDGGSP
jgi:DNA-binding transcriptional regulator YdaS (Cro superfamily)